MVDFWYYFRGHVSGSSTKSVDLFAFATSQTETKINQFELFVPVKQNVFGFDITMNDIEFMQVQQGLCNHQQELFSFSLLHSVLWFW